MDADLFRLGRQIDPTRIVTPNSGGGLVPGYPYDAAGCVDGEACWRMLDYHSHHSWYGAQPLDYWDTRQALEPEDHGMPPYDASGARLNFWRDDGFKAVFSALAGAESLPVWETVVEWSSVGVFEPPIVAPEDPWKPTWASPSDFFLAIDDLDGALFRPAGRGGRNDEAAWASYVDGALRQRFSAASGWCIRFGSSAYLSGSCDPDGDGNGDGIDDITAMPISEWIAGSQRFQADCLRLTIDALRRQRARVAGYFFFALTGGKGVIDDHGRPKEGLFALAQASAPVRVQIHANSSDQRDPRELGLCVDPAIEVSVLNDEQLALPGHVVHVIAIEPSTTTLDVLHASEHPVDVEPFSSVPVVSGLDLGMGAGTPYNLIVLLTDPDGEIVDVDGIRQPQQCM